MFYLDTNTCIYYLNGTFPAVRQNLLAHRPAEISIPSLVKAELLYGALKRLKKEENLEAVRRFLQPFRVSEFGDSQSEEYAEIRAELERAGTPVGANDLVIAATVRSHGGILVTNNTNEFQRVSGLVIEDWTLSRTIGAK